MFDGMFRGISKLQGKLLFAEKKTNPASNAGFSLYKKLSHHATAFVVCYILCFVYDTAVDHGHDRLGVKDVLWIDREQVSVDCDDVSQLAFFQ